MSTSCVDGWIAAGMAARLEGVGPAKAIALERLRVHVVRGISCGGGVSPMVRELQVHLSEDGADAERLALLTGFLRDELLELDVEDVTALPAGEPPPGARAFDVAELGGLLVTVSQSAGHLGAVVAAIRRWLGAGGGGTRRTVRLEIGGDVLELSEVTATEQQRLIDVFVQRHATTEEAEP